MDLKKLSPQILLILGLLFFGVGFAIYQGVQAFSDQKKSPAYQRTPSGGFYQPAPQTIIPTSSLDAVLNGDNDGFRPSDDALIAAIVGTERVAEALENGDLENYLEKKGYNISSDQALEVEDGYQLLIQENQIAEEGEAKISLIENDWSRISLESSALWPSGSGLDDVSAPPQVIVSWSEEDGEWIITDFSASWI